MPSRVTDPTAASGRFVPGATVGERYRIVGLLGRGGMGEVYRADDLELGQSVALKFLPERLAADPVALDRLRREVSTARKIAHPNVCRVYDIAQADGHVFLSMEYVDGDDLSHVLRRLGPPSKSKAIEIARQLCLGLAAAHENDILHRDLKPANVMLDGRGRVRITDFGLAGLADELEASPQRAGTPAYMAPEQLESGKVSVRSDIYSLGLVLYELFTGKRAYAGKTVEELKRSRATSSVPSMQTEDESVDPGIERVILHCLELNPADRPPSVYAVLAALPGGDPLAAALAAGETPSPELVANIRNAGGVRPWTAVSLLIAVLASLALVYFVFADSTVMPERSPAVLSVVAEQVLERLGYSELPPNSVSGFDVNADLSGSVLSSPRLVRELAEMDRPPRFAYWRRWTEGVFEPWAYHAPEVFRFHGATTTPWSDVSVALDSTGRLLRLRIPPSVDPQGNTWGEDVDWSPLFDLAGLDPSRATRAQTPAWPSVPVSTAVAWKIDDWPDSNGDPAIVVMAARGQRLVYFEVHGIDQSLQPALGFPFITTFSLPLLRVPILVGLVILALRNLRAGRGDRRNALRAALVIGALYTLLELLALPFGGPIDFDRIASFIGTRAIGHITIHTLEGWLAYMAIEPYVRRVWPRMLVGLVRLLSGRWRDPAVGREVLIGVALGYGFVGVLAVFAAAGGTLRAEGSGVLPGWGWLLATLSPLHYLSSLAHRAGWAAMDAAFIVGLLVALRLLTRRTLVAALVGVAVLGAMGSVSNFMTVGDLPSWLVIAFTVGGSAALVALHTRVGILAGVVATFVLRPHQLLTTGFDTWFAGYGAADVALLLALATYGFWVALAGQPVFSDMLAEPRAEKG